MFDTWFVVLHRDTGEAYSIGTVVADPLPAEFVAMPLSHEDADDINTGRATWNAATRSVVSRPKAEWPAIPGSAAGGS